MMIAGGKSRLAKPREETKFLENGVCGNFICLPNDHQAERCSTFLMRRIFLTVAQRGRVKMSGMCDRPTFRAFRNWRQSYRSAVTKFRETHRLWNVAHFWQ